MSIHVFEGQYDSFYRLALYNFGAWPYDYFIEIQAVQMVIVIYGDLTLYGHATIIKGIIGPYIGQSQYCPHVI